MTRLQKPLMLLAGFLLGIALTSVMGASQKADSPPPSMKYSVQLLPGSTVIVDHATEKLYVYENTETGADLKTIFDLKQTGKKKVISEKPAAE